MAALHRASQLKNIASVHDSAESHREYALQQYGRGLRGVQAVLERGRNSTRTVLIASLLIYSFENFHGDARLALRNLQSVLALMRNWLLTTPRSRNARGFSPAPNEVEDSLVVMYNQLDITVICCSETTHSFEESIVNFTHFDVPLIPSQFTSLPEAQDRWDMIFNHTTLYFLSILNVSTRRPSFTSDLSNTSGSGEDDDTGSPNPIAHPDILAEIYDWQAAFEPLLAHARSPSGFQTFVRASTMRVLSLLVRLSVRLPFNFSSPSPTSNPDDDEIPEFHEIVAICADIVRHPAFVRGFTLKAGLLPALFTVIAKCKGAALRSEAVAVLKAAGPRREGVFDGDILAVCGDEILAEECLEPELFKQENELGMGRFGEFLDLPEDEDWEGMGRVGGMRERERPVLFTWVAREMKTHVGGRGHQGGFGGGRSTTTGLVLPFGRGMMD